MNRFSRFLLFLLVIVLWEILALVSPSPLFPSPIDVVYAFNELLVKDCLVWNMLLSITRMLVGYVLGVVIGLGIGLVGLLSRSLGDVLYPLAAFITVTPAFAFFPLLMIWVRLNDALVIYALVICVSFPIIYSLRSSVKMINRDYIDAATMLGASKLNVLLHIVFPLSITHILSMLKIEAGHAWRLTIMGEFLALTNGLGKLLYDAYTMIRVDKIIALIIIVGLLAYIIQTSIEFIETKITRKWYGNSLTI